MTNNELTEIMAMSKRFVELYRKTGLVSLESFSDTPQVHLTDKCFKELFPNYKINRDNGYLTHDSYGIHFIALEK